MDRWIILCVLVAVCVYQSHAACTEAELIMKRKAAIAKAGIGADLVTCKMQVKSDFI